MLNLLMCLRISVKYPVFGSIHKEQSDVDPQLVTYPLKPSSLRQMCHFCWEKSILRLISPLRSQIDHPALKKLHSGMIPLNPKQNLSDSEVRGRRSLKEHVQPQNRLLIPKANHLPDSILKLPIKIHNPI